MKHRTNGRPIGKCKGCCLNMRGFCAAGLEPKAEWNRGRCRSQNDAAVLETFYHPIPATGAKATKLARRAKATEVATRPHYNGRLTPGRYVHSAGSRV